MKHLLVAAVAVVALCSCSSPTAAPAATSTAQVAAADAASPGADSASPVADIFGVGDAKSGAVASTAQTDQSGQPQAQGGPVQMNQRYGSRMPRACPDITSLPTAEQAATLVQCTMDGETAQQMKLNQDVTVTLGSSRQPTDTDRWPSIDSRAPVEDITGSATVYLCGPVLEEVMHNTGTNCDQYKYQASPGVCWKNLAGKYKCELNAPLTNVVPRQPPPTTF